ncbi:putative odorant-binding protein A10 [Copidosoma floridanum]|uniref:putative odorant-binding protein A10 n=1 Tax=Copidosoma floridanum TaxID=29053 RepID=UPI0006C9B381|nr:putative odorant-binding protein A10 [Copidosoma floridanum]
MRRALGLFVVLCTLVSAALADQEIYSDKYDYVDVDQILGNDRIREQYYNCFLDAAPCYTPDAKFFKDKFPEAIVTKCRWCTEKQKISFEKIVLHYTQKEPKKWEAVLLRAINQYQKKKTT